MKHRLLNWLACPVCRSARLSLEVARRETRRVPSTLRHADPRAEEEIIEGSLLCAECGRSYPVRDGVPRMRPDGAAEGPSSAHRFTNFDAAAPAWEESFVEALAPLGADELLGRVVLDAGCGYGRYTYFAARAGAEVVALDSSPDAIASAADNTADLHTVHLVEGDLRQPPLRDSTFDLVFCFGVLHHLEDPKAAFSALGELTRSGGELVVQVYGPRQGATLIATNALRGATSSMQPEQLHALSRFIAAGIRVGSHTPYRFFGALPGARTLVTHLPVHDHHRWPFDVVVADIYDRLRIPVRHWFTGERLERMFVEAGYADVQVRRRVRNNETFRGSGTRR